MSGAAIGIICKAPQSGRSKTRLAAAVGAVAASELSACFLRDVASAIEAVPGVLGIRGYGVYAPAGAEHIMRQLLPEWYDVDDIETLRWLQDELAGRSIRFRAGGFAPASRAFLKTAPQISP